MMQFDKTQKCTAKDVLLLISTVCLYIPPYWLDVFKFIDEYICFRVYSFYLYKISNLFITLRTHQFLVYPNACKPVINLIRDYEKLNME